MTQLFVAEALYFNATYNIFLFGIFLVHIFPFNTYGTGTKNGIFHDN